MEGAGRLLVFDWDGTLVDSLGRIVSTMQQAITAAGLPARSDTQIRAVVGLGLPEALASLYPELPGLRHEQLREAYRAQFLSTGLTAELFPGARDTLDALATAGYTISIATGKGRAGLDRELGETGLMDLVVASRCADECRSKPAPEMLQQLMEATGAAPSETVMVGDSEFDLLMALNAGVRSIGIAGGAHANERLLQHRPLAILESVVHLPGVLHGRSGQLETEAP
jgi:phosphoglycolate phosphatase